MVDLEAVTDWHLRGPKEHWWLVMRPLLRVLPENHDAFEAMVVNLKDHYNNSLSDYFKNESKKCVVPKYCS